MDTPENWILPRLARTVQENVERCILLGGVVSLPGNSPKISCNLSASTDNCHGEHLGWNVLCQGMGYEWG